MLLLVRVYSFCDSREDVFELLHGIREPCPHLVGESTIASAKRNHDDYVMTNPGAFFFTS